MYCSDSSSNNGSNNGSNLYFYYVLNRTRFIQVSLPKVQKGLPHSGKSVGQRYTLTVIHPHTWKHPQIPSALHWCNETLPGHLWWGIIKVCHIRIKYHKQITCAGRSWTSPSQEQPPYPVTLTRSHIAWQQAYSPQQEIASYLHHFPTITSHNPHCAWLHP